MNKEKENKVRDKSWHDKKRESHNKKREKKNIWMIKDMKKKPDHEKKAMERRESVCIITKKYV